VLVSRHVAVDVTNAARFGVWPCLPAIAAPTAAADLALRASGDRRQSEDDRELGFGGLAQ